MREEYLKNLQLLNSAVPNLAQYLQAYTDVVNRFGFTPVLERGTLELLGWDLEYHCGAALPNFIDQILVRRLNDFIPDTSHPVILDCGANIGFSTLAYKRQFPMARIIAFEPDPQLLPVLRRNLEVNHAHDVRVEAAAVWVERGEMPWFLEGIDGSHLDLSARGSQNTTTVPTIDLAQYLNTPVDLLKLDVEGAEFEILRHLKGKLGQVKNLSIECHVRQDTIALLGEVVSILRAEGFYVSMSSFGAWRDLLHQPKIDELHYEGYFLVSAFRSAPREGHFSSSWLSAVGVQPILDVTAAFEEYLRQRESQFQSRISELEQKLGARESFLGCYSRHGEKSLRQRALTTPFTCERGKSWKTSLRDLSACADSCNTPNRSPLLLFEDGVLLQYPHATHQEIGDLGGGRYSHWLDTLYFSTSDGTDPNTNGRAYSVVYVEEVAGSEGRDSPLSATCNL
jgi:FkbM family methyltransferase